MKTTLLLIAAILYLPVALAGPNSDAQTLQTLNAQNRAAQTNLNTHPADVDAAERARTQRTQQDIQRGQRQINRGQTVHPSVPTIQQQMRQQRALNPTGPTPPSGRGRR